MKLLPEERDWLETFIRGIRRSFPGRLERVMIFGSKACGEAGPHSDLDVLVILTGEALDKVGKMLGIDYPVGAEIDRLAQDGDPNAIRFPRPMASSPGFDFSFAGLKTSVLYYLNKHPRERQEDVAASFLASVVEVLVKKSLEGDTPLSP